MLLAGLVLFSGLISLPDAKADFSAGLAAYDAGDYRAALEAWRPLALAGDATAQVALAGLYSDGLGTPGDPVEALRWYRRAAEQGDPVGQLNLGDLLARGVGGPRDLVGAYFWLALSADQGRIWAARRLEKLKTSMTPAERAEAERLIAARRAKQP